MAAEHRAEVVLAPIVDNARVNPDIRARVSFDTSSAEGNDMTKADIVDAATVELLKQFDGLIPAVSVAKASDVAGAVSWAAQTLANSRPAWHAIVVLADATSTAPPCNMTLTPPSVDVAAAITACFPAGVPSFGGATLFFLGAGADPSRALGPAETAGLEQFWREVAQAGQGEIGAYGATVLGPPK